MMSMEKRILIYLPAHLERAIGQYKLAMEERWGFSISRQKILIQLLSRGLVSAQDDIFSGTA